MMAGIRGINTKPELAVRRGLHAAGFRFRLHDKRLAGKPDLLLPKHRAAIFINGCFWHGHDCHLFRWPQSREDFWRTKIEGNVARDAKAYAALSEAGWRVLCVWECSLKGKRRLGVDQVVSRIVEWIGSEQATGQIRGG